MVGFKWRNRNTNHQAGSTPTQQQHAESSARSSARAPHGVTASGRRAGAYAAAGGRSPRDVRSTSLTSAVTSVESDSTGFSGFEAPSSPANVFGRRDQGVQTGPQQHRRPWRRTKDTGTPRTATSAAAAASSNTVSESERKRKASEAGHFRVGPGSSSMMTGSQYLRDGGERKIDQYLILETLGEGYSGKVKRGIDTFSGEVVALKIMSKMPEEKVPAHKKFVRLQAEVEAMKTCANHPHVIKLFNPLFNKEYCNRDGSKEAVHILVMELCEKGELFELLWRDGPVPPNVSKEYFRQLMSGLNHCHGRGVVHRDLKPENLLLDEEFTLKIADFGFAATHRDKGCQSVVGSRSYMAPEVMSQRTREYDGELADVWSAGVILFVMLAGHPPMEKAEESDWWFRALKLGRRDLFWQSHERNIQPGNVPTSPEAKDLISMMLTVDPTKRITVPQIMNHPYVARPRRSLFHRAPDPGPELRAEMHRRYERSMACKRLCTLTQSSRATAESAGTSLSGSPTNRAGDMQGQDECLYSFGAKTWRKANIEQPAVMSLDKAATAKGGFMATGEAMAVIAELEKVLRGIGAKIDGVGEDGTRSFLSARKVSATIPRDSETGGGQVGIVATLFRIDTEGVAPHETGEIPDFVVLLRRRKEGDYYRYRKVEEAVISRMTFLVKEHEETGGNSFVSSSPPP